MVRKRNDFSWITVTKLGIYFIFFLYFASYTEATISENFCDSSTNYNLFKTPCINCWQNRRTRCPRGARKVTRMSGTRGCRYQLQVGGRMQTARGCTHTCREEITTTRCCDGYWGQDCQSCPIDSTGTVCGGRGTCSDGVSGNGTCNCNDNLMGSICEKCINPLFYGPNCASVCACAHGTCDSGINGTGSCFCQNAYGGRLCDQELTACSSLSCHVNASCLNITGTVGCNCNQGYTGDGMTCGEINPCETGTNTPCNVNATCVHIGPDQSSCKCKDGYAGDGSWCQAIDPCQTNNGGCMENSTNCKYDGPAQSHCECKYGFDNKNSNTIKQLGCQLVDVCGKYEKTTCDSDAVCETVVDGGQITVKCTCPPESLEFNRVCYYDLLSELTKLNETDTKFANKLNFAIHFFQVTYGNLLFNPSPWTLFVPVDDAFPSLMKDNISSSPLWKVKARAHIVSGSINVNFTENSAKTMYPVLGYDYPIRLLRPGQVPDASEDDDDEGYFADLRFGGKFTGKVLVDAKPAYNGMLYIIDTLLEPADSASLISASSTLETLKSFDSLSNFTNLIMKSHSFQAKLMIVRSHALFAPTNDAMSSMTDDEMSYITSYLGRSSLEELLGYNMLIQPRFPSFITRRFSLRQPASKLPVLSMIRRKVLRNFGTITVNVSSVDGSISLGIEEAKILKSEIVVGAGGAKELYIYIVDKLMIPESIKPLVKNRCEVSTEKNVRGPCGNCIENLCPPGGKPLPSESSEVLTCVYKAEVQTGDGPNRIGPKMGCNRLCSTVVKTDECCAGFYGSKCRSCPGPTHDACNSHGICSDNEMGTGLCACNANFTGMGCDQCVDTGKYGRDCTQDCLCQHGTCKNTIGSHGECVAGSCEDGWSGENCDREIVPCANGTLVCHQFAQCVVDDFGNSSCVCDPGYAGSGDDCIEFNPCQTRTCSINAFCLHLGGGKVACECMPHYSGNGKTCTAIDPCESENRGGCSEFAQCLFAGPGKHHCTCKQGYRGDGRVCTEINACENNNGGCHRRALCTRTGPGTRTCKCFDGYDGDGTVCVGNLLQEIALRSDLSQLQSWISGWPSTRLLLVNLGPGFTCFLPDDSAWTSLSSDDYEFWINEMHFPYLLKRHISQNKILSKNLIDLKGKTVPSLLPSVVININTVTVGTSDTNVNNNETVQQNLPTLGKSLYVKLMVSDLPVRVDGVIHIIDSVLLPPKDVVTDYPPLSTMISNMIGTDLEPYSSFLNSVNSTGVLSQIEDSDNTPYTLFIAPNTASNLPPANMTLVDRTKLFQYHVIKGKIIRASDISSGEHVDALIGAGYKLTLVRRHGGILVNGQEVTGTGNRTATGIIYKLSERYLTLVKTRCDGSSIQQVRSHCLPCYYPNNCPPNSDLIAKENCLFSHKTGGGAIKTSVGCQMRCSQKLAEPKCCPGFFGPGCEPCPGGVGNVCFGVGTCTDGMKNNGICVCSDSKYDGIACETCAKGRYGRTCDQQCQCQNGKCNEGVEGDGTCTCNIGYRGPLCNVAITEQNSCNGTCHSWANCIPVSVGSGSICVCSSGYSGDGRNCQAIKPCDNPNTAGCHVNANCVNGGAGQHNCTCKSNYEGDGRQCTPVNPCFKSFGPSCDPNADCFMISPNVSKCVCRDNYVGDGKSCDPLDVCQTNNGGCSENAICKKTGPGTKECMCKDDYVGDGVTCIGSIFSYISGRPEFEWFTLMDSFASLAPHILAQGGPIMAFLPSQSVMMSLPTTMTAYEEPGTQLYLNHIVGCVNLKNLTGVNRLRTLAGDVLTITQTDSGFKINQNISVLDEPIEFWNGFLYQIDSALIPTSVGRIMNKTTEPTKIIRLLQPYLENSSDTSEPLYKNTKLLLDNGFQWVMTLLETAGGTGWLQNPLHNPWTLLLPPEDAFLKLSTQRLRLFLDTDNPTSAVEYIKYHMVREAFIDPTTFMTSHGMNARLRTMQGSNVVLSCAKSKDRYGDIIVNNGSATVIGFDVFHFTTQLKKEKKAAIYIIDTVLDPPSIGGRCDETDTNEQKTCSLCLSSSTRCPDNTTLINQQECTLELDSDAGDGTTIGVPGCEVTCSGYKTVHHCCQYYYGADCHACPGGEQSPCSGNGLCDDGLNGSGKCTCKEGFQGYACERCEQARFGRNCHPCLCTVHGSCNAGINGDGTCFCDKEWTGTNCDQKRTDATICNPVCHHNGYCVKSGTCFCKPGYRGDGVDSCEFMDMCKVNNGGCSPYATCSIVREKIVCKCLPNFVGDGYVCEGYDPCTTTTNGCHAQATCLYISANVSRCVCKAGYDGDGVNLCTRKQPRNCAEDRGGCSGHARCVDIPPQTPGDFPSVNCTCNVGYIGDGITCRGTILQVITESPEMIHFMRQLRRVGSASRRLGLKQAKFTVFVPVGSKGFRGRNLQRTAMIQRHIVPREVHYYKDLQGMKAITMQSHNIFPISKTSPNDLYINGVRIQKSDIIATNGVIHLIDSFITQRIVPVSTPASTASTASTTSNKQQPPSSSKGPGTTKPASAKTPAIVTVKPGGPIDKEVTSKTSSTSSSAKGGTTSTKSNSGSPASTTQNTSKKTFSDAVNRRRRSNGIKIGTAIGVIAIIMIAVGVIYWWKNRHTGGFRPFTERLGSSDSPEEEPFGGLENPAYDSTGFNADDDDVILHETDDDTALALRGDERPISFENPKTS